ncbi:LexA family protein [Undibacterium sp. SXout7W]|uniref:LexA family protein n=1 Tax=Undibacterium sp. SXout7W TaxID=3413049 RepID=UPI003BF43AA7
MYSIIARPFEIILFNAGISAGFPSPAADYAQKRIDLTQKLILNTEATYLFRVAGDSMEGIGIYDGDTIIVDRAIVPASNNIVLAIVDEEFTVKRFFKRGQVVRLLPENPKYKPMELREGQELRIWGVVTYNLRKLY